MPADVGSGRLASLKKPMTLQAAVEAVKKVRYQPLTLLMVIHASAPTSALTVLTSMLIMSVLIRAYIRAYIRGYVLFSALISALICAYSVRLSAFILACVRLIHAHSTSTFLTCASPPLAIATSAPWLCVPAAARAC